MVFLGRMLWLMCLFLLLRWSPSFVMVCRGALIGKMLCRSPFLSTKSVHFVVQVRKEEMLFEGSRRKAPPIARRRMTPPTPLQNSYTSFEGEQGSYEGEARGWCARERTIIARTKQYLERSFSVKLGS